MYNNITSTILMVAALVLLFSWIWWLSSRPENKGKQWGIALIQDLVKKHVSYLMGFVLTTNLASAGIAAAIAGEHSNPAARMTTHFAIFAVSVFGAFSLLPSWRMAFTKDKITPGRRTARIIALAIIAGFAILAPIGNMYLIAHSLHQVPHLNLFFMSFTPDWIVSDDEYLMALINSGITLPDNIKAYSPFQGMETILAAEIFVLILGMLVLFVEVLTAPDNHVRTIEQIEEEIEEDNKKKEDDKKDDKDKDKKKEPENALSTNFSKILAFVSIPITEAKLKFALGVVEEFSDTDVITFSNELDELYANVVKHPGLKTEAEKAKNLKVTEEGIRDIFKRPKSKLGIGQQLPAKK
jgi:hypothetical protein